MDDSVYKWLVRFAILLSLFWIGWTIYDSDIGRQSHANRELSAASKYIEDGQYRNALDIYLKLLDGDPDNPHLLYGKGLSLMQLGIEMQSGSDSEQPHDDNHYSDALHCFNRVIDNQEKETTSANNHDLLAVSYANRGILKDNMGDHIGALEDYVAALELKPELKKGPGLLTRFFRNQAQPPPTIADRAEYLTEQLALPDSERVLRRHELDKRQRSYKM